MKKGRSTQSLVNTFPGWSNTRVDEQSGGYQFLNVVGRRLDDLRKQAAQITDNYYLPTSVVSDIDVFYQFRLPGDFEFTKEDDDDTELLYTAPSVSGVVNGSWYSVAATDDNDVEDFWYNQNPSRLSLVETVTDDHVLIQGTVDDSPLNPLTPSGLLHSPNRLTVKLSGGDQYFDVLDNQVISRGLVQIEGTTREGAEVTEELAFVHDETLQTFRDFKAINASGVRVYGVSPTDTDVLVTSAHFQADDYPVNYQLDSAVTGEDMPLFWAVGSGVQSGVNTVDLLKYDIDELELRLGGFVTKQVALQQEILDIEGSGMVPKDIALEPHSERLWVATDYHLHVFDAELPFPDLSVLRGKDYDAISVIEPNTYYTVLGEEIELNYIWRKPTVGLVKHRVWVEKPDGTQYSLEDGAEVTYHTDSTSWVFGEPTRRKIRDTEFYTLDQRGDYVYTLEVTYTDESTSIDKRVVSVLYQEAQAEYALAPLGITTAVVGVDFDSEYKLWVLDASGVKYQLDRHHDVMLIDFERKILYFREPYDQVRVV